MILPHWYWYRHRRRHVASLRHYRWRRIVVVVVDAGRAVVTRRRSVAARRVVAARITIRVTARVAVARIAVVVAVAAVAVALVHRLDAARGHCHHARRDQSFDLEHCSPPKRAPLRVLPTYKRYATE